MRYEVTTSDQKFTASGLTLVAASRLADAINSDLSLIGITALAIMPQVAPRPINWQKEARFQRERIKMGQFSNFRKGNGYANQ